MAVILFNVVQFRTAFPAFADPVTFPTPTLQGYWDSATCIMQDYVSNCDVLNSKTRTRALNLLTAHLAQLSTMVAAGQTVGLVQGATIDKVSVTLTPPPVKNQWQWWLSLTPYGSQLLALLQAHTAGGIYIPALPPERNAFRKNYGVF